MATAVTGNSTPRLLVLQLVTPNDIKYGSRSGDSGGDSVLSRTGGASSSIGGGIVGSSSSGEANDLEQGTFYAISRNGLFIKVISFVRDEVH